MNAVTRIGNKVRRLAGATVGIPPRQIDFHFAQNSSRYMYGNNATASLHFAVLSGFFPPGEMFFVESVRRYRDRITDDRLKAAVSGFIGQEAIHSREHDRLNAFLKARGMDTAVAEKTVKAGLWLLSRLPASQQLACTTFMEHFTASLAEQLLTDEDFRRRADPALLTLWEWHALEELEHKSVTYDVYNLVGNRWYQRLLALPLVVGSLTPGLLISWSWMVAREGKATDWKDIAEGVTLLLGRKGFITKILPLMPEFFARDFHPDQRDTSALEKEWREKLFGENGVLRDAWRNAS
ncbi:MAG: metal-dependent hydrolase [Pseudomonadota bacterium]|nr:metal-dependent hydrolase [Pseudomonadota bacterium]